MLRYQIKTSKTATDKIEAAGGDESIAKEILDGLKWRLAHDPKLGTYVIDQKRNIHLIKSAKLTNKDPVVAALYRIIKGDPEYDMEIMDIDITT
jgi:hypothetical protein